MLECQTEDCPWGQEEITENIEMMREKLRSTGDKRSVKSI